MRIVVIVYLVGVVILMILDLISFRQIRKKNKNYEEAVNSEIEKDREERQKVSLKKRRMTTSG